MCLPQPPFGDVSPPFCLFLMLDIGIEAKSYYEYHEQDNKTCYIVHYQPPFNLSLNVMR